MLNKMITICCYLNEKQGGCFAKSRARPQEALESQTSVIDCYSSRLPEDMLRMAVRLGYPVGPAKEAAINV
jgi:hypothetical protein